MIAFRLKIWIAVLQHIRVAIVDIRVEVTNTRTRDTVIVAKFKIRYERRIVTYRYSRYNIPKLHIEIFLFAVGEFHILESPFESATESEREFFEFKRI